MKKSHFQDAATFATFRAMMKRIARERKSFLIAFVLFFVQAALLYSITPYFISRIIAELASGTTFETSSILFWLMGFLVTTVIAGGIFNKIAFMAYANLRARTRERLEVEAAQGVLQKDYTFFSNQKVGSLTSNYIGYVEGHSAIIDSIFLDSITLFASYTASLVIITILAPYLTPILVLLTVSFVIHSAYSLNKRTDLRVQRKTEVSSMRGYVADMFGNSLLVKVFGRETYEIDQITSQSKSIGKLFDTESKIMAYDGIVRIGILYLFQIGTIIAIVLMFQAGILSLMIMIFVITYLIKTANDVFKTAPILRTIEQAMVDASNMTTILQDTSHIKDSEDAQSLKINSSQVTFENVSFDYSDENNNVRVFRNLSFAIQNGERIGLVGPSGGGKSTITKLVLRFLDIQSGSISIDGQDIRSVTQTSLRSQIAYVPQEPFLFHRSLRDNISYGSEHATPEQIQDAVKRAHAEDFIDGLPHGLDTIVGERGVKLSGGQKQRIAIARAILKDAPILILDEATSALDSESERLVQAALNELMKGKTSLVIAHRLSTIQTMDRIIVLDKGEIIEQGNHNELLNANGLYAKLWKHQSGGFIDE